MQEYYARSSERNVLRHAQYKYKDKYRSKKSGKWVYVYDDIKGAVNKVGNAIGEATGYNARKRALRAYNNTLNKAIKSGYERKQLSNLNNEVADNYNKIISEGNHNSLTALKSVTGPISAGNKQLAQRSAMANQIEEAITKKSRDDAKKQFDKDTSTVAYKTQVAKTIKANQEFDAAQQELHKSVNEYRNTLLGKVEDFIVSSSEVIDKGKNFVSSLFNKKSGIH